MVAAPVIFTDPVIVTGEVGPALELNVAMTVQAAAGILPMKVTPLTVNGQVPPQLPNVEPPVRVYEQVTPELYGVDPPHPFTVPVPAPAVEVVRV
jgi:hypothetical protein